MAAVVRRAVAADRPRIQEVVDRAFEGYIPAIGVPPGPMTADYGAWIAEGVVDVAVVEVGGDDAAVDGVVVHWPEEGDLYIEVLAVDPQRQGRGIGVALVVHVAGVARAAGLARLRLHTNEAMTESLAWYLRHGFEEARRMVVQGYRRIELVHPL